MTEVNNVFIENRHPLVLQSFLPVTPNFDNVIFVFLSVRWFGLLGFVLASFGIHRHVVCPQDS